mmetsp:Transcript_27605/g.48032  ORF Transcript_27605/g.48032 Transcript_27605/m.48032 type:complete len:415 (-) Transcript_27605:80-1324(-)
MKGSLNSSFGSLRSLGSIGSTSLGSFALKSLGFGSSKKKTKVAIHEKGGEQEQGGGKHHRLFTHAPQVFTPSGSLSGTIGPCERDDEPVNFSVTELEPQLDAGGSFVRRSSSTASEREASQLRFRDDTLNPYQNETKAETLARARTIAEAEADREGESGPTRDERIRKALFLAELKLTKAEEQATAMQKAEEAMLMQVLDKRSRKEVEGLNGMASVMVYLPVREFTVTDGVKHRTLCTLLAALGLDDPDYKAIAMDRFLTQHPVCVVLRVLTLPGFLVSTLALLGKIPPGWVWATLVTWADLLRTFFRLNVDVLSRCDDLFRFYIPVCSLAGALLMAMISFDFNAGAVHFLMCFGSTMTVGIFLNDASLSKRRLSRPRAALPGYLVATTIYAMWMIGLTLGAFYGAEDRTLCQA